MTSFKLKLRHFADEALIEELERRGFTTRRIVPESAAPEPVKRRITAFQSAYSLNDTHTTEELERVRNQSRRLKTGLSGDDNDDDDDS